MPDETSVGKRLPAREVHIDDYDPARDDPVWEREYEDRQFRKDQDLARQAAEMTLAWLESRLIAGLLPAHFHNELFERVEELVCLRPSPETMRPWPADLEDGVRILGDALGLEWRLDFHGAGMPPSPASDPKSIEAIRKGLRLVAGLGPGSAERTPRETESGDQTATHGPDFRSVAVSGRTYSFTKMQAPIVALLWSAWENETPDVGAETLLEEVDAQSSRLADIFRDNAAWGTLIVDGSTKGTKRLSIPPIS